ncbi:glycosyltransferase family 1 protein, partial [Bacillus tropicus]|nr:glycosyltransferase family 1 protein [Bacillus tropicus]
HTAEDNFLANVNKLRSIPLTILYQECRFSFPTPRIRRVLLSFLPVMIHIATPFHLGLCVLYFAPTLNIPVVVSY